MGSKDYTVDNGLIYGNREEKTLYIHWMTNLLPYEIDYNIKHFIEYKDRRRVSAWVGTYVRCPRYGNYDEIHPFEEESAKSGIPFIKGGLYSGKVMTDEENQDLVSGSYLAPAINGFWQRDNGYIPCRIFKNISYGHISGTNSIHVSKLFQDKIPYNKDTVQLFHDMRKSVEAKDAKEKTIALMEMVRDKFTYVNLIEYILGFMKFIHPEFNYEIKPLDIHPLPS
jgi:hypothetical protein